MFSDNIRGSFFAISSGFLYGFLGFFGLSALNNGLSINTMLFWRFFIASLVLLLTQMPFLPKIAFFSSAFVQAFLNGAVFYGLSTLLFFHASQYIGSGLAMVIFFSYPLMVMLLNIFLYRHHISRLCYLSILVILSGMLLIVDFQALQFNLTGLLTGLLSGFFYACYIVSSKNNRLSPEVSTLAVSLGCTFTFCILSLVHADLAFPESAIVWLDLIGIGTISTAIPLLLLLYSLKWIGSTKASLLSVLEPVFVVIFGVLLLGESLKPVQIPGMFLILAGALITLFARQPKKHINENGLSAFGLDFPD